MWIFMQVGQNVSFDNIFIHKFEDGNSQPFILILIKKNGIGEMELRYFRVA